MACAHRGQATTATTHCRPADLPMRLLPRAFALLLLLETSSGLQCGHRLPVRAARARPAVAARCAPAHMMGRKFENNKLKMAKTALEAGTMNIVESFQAFAAGDDSMLDLIQGCRGVCVLRRVAFTSRAGPTA